MKYRGGLLAAALGAAMVVFACGGTDSGAIGSPGGDSDASGADGTAGGGGDAANDAATSGDAANDAPGEAAVDAGPFHPGKLPGLSLWLDDTVGVVMNPLAAGRVKRWLDQSGLGNNAEAAGGDGVISTPALDPAAVNGKDAILCDSQTYFTIPSVSSLQFGTGDWGIVMVAKVSVQAGAAGSAPLYQKVAPNGVALTVTGEGSLRLDAQGPTGTGGGSALLAGAPSSAFQLFAARGRALEVSTLLGTATGPTTTADVSGDNAPVTFCRAGTDPSSVAEVIVVKGKLSDVNLAKTKQYLKKKFGL